VYIKNSAGDVVGPIGEGGGGGLSDLVTGDSRDFWTSLGDWTNSGGTLTRDTVSKVYGGAASGKLVTTTAGNNMILPIDGTFTAGLTYTAVVWVSYEETDASINVLLTFGDLNASDYEQPTIYWSPVTYPGISGPDNFVCYFISWTPTADRTDVSFKMQRSSASGTRTLRVGGIRVFQTPTIGSIALYDRSYLPMSAADGMLKIGAFDGTSGLLKIEGTSGDFDLMDSSGLQGVYTFGRQYVGLYAASTAAGDKTSAGVNIEVGDDYLGFFIGQKNADTVQFYGDYDDYNFEFEDGAANGWKFVSGDGAVAWPAKGKRPQYTAAPSTPVEGQSYYNTTDHKEYVWNGSAWVELGGTGTFSGDAGDVPITDAGGYYTGTDVEAALQEAGSGLSGHLSDTTDAHDASAVSIVDTGTYFTSTDVEGALQEIGAAGFGGMSNPMTTVNDLIVGGTSGAPARLAKGNDSQILTVDPSTHNVAWKDPAAGFTSPLTTKGDVHVYSTTDTRLGVGTNGYVMAARSSETTGLAWEAQYSTVNYVIDGGGSAISTGIKGDVIVDFAATIVSATLLADQSGSIVIDLWKDTYANYAPTDADSITSSAPPTLSSAIKSQDTALTGWTTSIAAGDVLRFNVDSATTVTRVTLALKLRRT
jgi:hypothetical protein